MTQQRTLTKKQHRIWLKDKRSFNAAIDIDDTLESDGIVIINRLVSLSPTNKTKQIRISQNGDLEVQFFVRVFFSQA